MQYFLLDLYPLTEKHTAINIQQTIERVLNEAKITEKLLGITTDNAQNMIAAGWELKNSLNNSELVHQWCAAHILNLAVQHGLQLVSPVIKKVRDFVIKIRNSTKLSDSLKTVYNQENVNELKPDLDVETRWNSTYLMLEKFLKMRDMLDIFVAKNKNLSPLYLQDNE